jgi:hypothetical protein
MAAAKDAEPAGFYLRISATIHWGSSDEYSVETSADLQSLMDEDDLKNELETAEDVNILRARLGEPMQQLFGMTGSSDSVDYADSDGDRIEYKNIDWKQYPPFENKHPLPEGVTVCIYCDFCNARGGKKCEKCGRGRVIDIDSSERLSSEEEGEGE